jgi:hypothetical protein
MEHTRFLLSPLQFVECADARQLLIHGLATELHGAQVGVLHGHDELHRLSQLSQAGVSLPARLAQIRQGAPALFDGAAAA